MAVVFHKKFLKQQSKYKKSIRVQIEHRVGIFIGNPFSPVLNNHALHHPFEDCFSINISGDLRAIYQLQKNGDTLFIRIGSHSQLYK